MRRWDRVDSALHSVHDAFVDHFVAEVVTDGSISHEKEQDEAAHDPAGHFPVLRRHYR